MAGGDGTPPLPYHVRAVRDARAVLSGRTDVSHAPPQVAADDVARAREGTSVPIYCNAFAWSSLTSNVEVRGERYAGRNLYDTRDVEYDYAIWLRDCIAQRAGSGVLEVRDMVDGRRCRRARSDGEAAPSERTGERRPRFVHLSAVFSP